MSYSCTSRGSSQDPSSANPARTTGGTDGGTDSTGGPKQTAAMKVKKGCNSADVEVPVTTEEELLGRTAITPEDVLGLQKITELNSGPISKKISIYKKAKLFAPSLQFSFTPSMLQLRKGKTFFFKFIIEVGTSLPAGAPKQLQNWFSNHVCFGRSCYMTLLIIEMVLHPYETQSDSFYFVDNKLVMHNKADYSYSGGT
uniref:Protein unc-119 homolog A n=1 Tax=Fundulus heteroclitus TaxID=8078 RepID=A0A3Q2Q0E6_FUNHE